MDAFIFFFFFQAEDGIRDIGVTGVQTCALPISTAQEEIFGPVLAVIRARDFDHAVQIANDTRFGLTSGIATKSLRYTQEFVARSEAARSAWTPAIKSGGRRSTRSA